MRETIRGLDWEPGRLMPVPSLPLVRRVGLIVELCRDQQFVSCLIKLDWFLRLIVIREAIRKLGSLGAGSPNVSSCLPLVRSVDLIMELCYGWDLQFVVRLIKLDCVFFYFNRFMISLITYLYLRSFLPKSLQLFHNYIYHI